MKMMNLKIGSGVVLRLGKRDEGPVIGYKFGGRLTEVMYDDESDRICAYGWTPLCGSFYMAWLSPNKSAIYYIDDRDGEVVYMDTMLAKRLGCLDNKKE